VEYALLRNMDVFAGARRLSLYPIVDGAPSNSYRGNVVTDFGREVEVECDMAAGDGSWVVTGLRLYAPWTRDLGTTGTQWNGRNIAGVPPTVPPPVVAAAIAPLNSDAFRQRVIDDAGLSGWISPALLARMYAVGISPTSSGGDILLPMSDPDEVVQCYARSRAAIAKLHWSAVYRGGAEVRAALLDQRIGLNWADRLHWAENLFGCGYDDVTIPCLRRLAAGESGERRQLLQAMADYLDSHRLPPHIPPTFAAYAYALNEGESLPDPDQIYWDTVFGELAQTLSAAGLQPKDVRRSTLPDFRSGALKQLEAHFEVPREE
jgi:hypothetical protein